MNIVCEAILFHHPPFFFKTHRQQKNISIFTKFLIKKDNFINKNDENRSFWGPYNLEKFLIWFINCMKNTRHSSFSF